MRGCAKDVTRMLGEHAVVVGMATVEYDKTRNKWQPHYHMMIYGGSAARFTKVVKILLDQAYRPAAYG